MNLKTVRSTARSEKGIALVVALLLLLVLTLLGMSSVRTTNIETVISGNERMGNTALYASEAGIQVGLHQLPQTSAISKTEIGADTHFSATLNDLGLAHKMGNDQGWAFRRYRVNAAGDSQGASRQIEVEVRCGPFPSGTGYNN